MPSELFRSIVKVRGNRQNSGMSRRARPRMLRDIRTGIELNGARMRLVILAGPTGQKPGAGPRAGSR